MTSKLPPTGVSEQDVHRSVLTVVIEPVEQHVFRERIVYGKTGGF
jgi:hypothetical protein